MRNFFYGIRKRGGKKKKGIQPPRFDRKECDKIVGQFKTTAAAVMCAMPTIQLALGVMTSAERW